MYDIPNYVIAFVTFLFTETACLQQKNFFEIEIFKKCDIQLFLSLKETKMF